MGATGPGAEVVLSSFDDGVAAIVGRAAEVDWDRPACGSWSAAEVVRHVAGVVSWYHGWLDRALAGDDAPPFDSGELARRNAEVLDARSGQDPAAAVAEFEAEADRYRSRLPEHWDLPYGYPAGTVTAGLHAAVAAAEWHLHAWDLADAAGRDHRPDDPAGLFLAAGRCVTIARGGAVGAAQWGFVRVGARARPWEQLLRASGRRPRRR